MRASYTYVENGYDLKGRKLPAIPVIWLELIISRARLRGPCIIDTGFDGSLYANEELALLLEDVEAKGVDFLYTVGDQEIECEIFEAEGFIITEDGKRLFKLGVIPIYVPTSPENLSREVIVGRGVLNRLTLKLNGKIVELL